MDKTDITIIGAGVVGLAIAARVSRQGRSVAILEKNDKFGQETSSRNSEVIHSGIYYPTGSLKARLCVRGNALLYEYCKKHGVNHNPCGKIIIAVSPEEQAALERLYQKGSDNGVPGLSLLTSAEVRRLEPEISACTGMLSPSTGILDTHSLMQNLLAEARSNDALLSCTSEVAGIERAPDGFVVAVKDSDYRFHTRILINCAGLHSDTVAAMAGIDINEASYRLHYCKGNYFRLRKTYKIHRLIYPVPDPQIHSLGIHLTRDLAGGLRFGPDARYVDQVDYAIDEARKEAFYTAVRRYLPGVALDDLYPDTVGVRPKLQGPDDEMKDFVIRDESDRNLPGLINLIGIESPGLTSSLAIADHVNQMVSTYL